MKVKPVRYLSRNINIESFNGKPAEWCRLMLLSKGLKNESEFFIDNSNIISHFADWNDNSTCVGIFSILDNKDHFEVVNFNVFDDNFWGKVMLNKAIKIANEYSQSLKITIDPLNRMILDDRWKYSTVNNKIEAWYPGFKKIELNVEIYEGDDTIDAAFCHLEGDDFSVYLYSGLEIVIKFDNEKAFHVDMEKIVNLLR